nr:Wzz/FepE/Etk N-terminal domain-containing protein [Aliifodinibius salipaludis]
MDLIELAQTFWDAREKIVKITGAFLVLGLLIALFSPKEYSTEATLMPETQSAQSGASGLLQQYGGMLGISGSQLSGGQEGSIPPQLYPNIVQSLPYQVELMNTEVYFSEYDTTATVHDFFSGIHSPSVLGYARQFTIGLPGQIIGLFKAEEQDVSPLPKKVDRDSVLKLNREQMETVKILRERLSISVDQETGILTLTSEFPDPQAAAEIGRVGINLLKESVKEYRTQKARQNLEFVREQVEEVRKRFEEAQQQLAEFRDSNLNLATAKAQSREQELQSRYDLTFNLYNSLSQREEQAKLDLQEETPVLSVLQPVSVPLEDNTSGLLILIVSGMLGGIISLGWVLVSSWWKQEKVRFK